MQTAKEKRSNVAGACTEFSIMLRYLLSSSTLIYGHHNPITGHDTYGHYNPITGHSTDTYGHHKHHGGHGHHHMTTAGATTPTTIPEPAYRF
ncbi:hypothetical protein MKW92_011956 [Papaver armeniacum]|nr:hypothetical protein MKW92_011956 [Papaver armeniacum]